MTALGEEIKISTPPPNGPSNQLFALPITLSSINDVHPSVENRPKQSIHLLDGRATRLPTHLITTKPQHTHMHISFAKRTLLHGYVPSKRVLWDADGLRF